MKLTYAYDRNGNVTSAQDSLGGTTAYAYDALNRLAQGTQAGSGVQEKRVDFSYSGAELLWQLKRFANLAGTQPVMDSSLDYDSGGCAGRLSRITHGASSIAFTRDVVGNIRTITDSDGSHTYDYDALRRLISATHSNPGLKPNESCTCNAVGNRLASHLSSSYK